MSFAITYDLLNLLVLKKVPFLNLQERKFRKVNRINKTFFEKSAESIIFAPTFFPLYAESMQKVL